MGDGHPPKLLLMAQPLCQFLTGTVSPIVFQHLDQLWELPRLDDGGTQEGDPLLVGLGVDIQLEDALQRGVER